MDRMETVKNVVANRGRAIADKAKELTQIAKLKAQIVSCEEIIRKNYLEIGKKVFEAYDEARSCEEENAELSSHEQTGQEGNPIVSKLTKSSAWEARYKKQCTAIDNANKAIEDLQRRIEELQK